MYSYELISLTCPDGIGENETPHHGRVVPYSCDCLIELLGYMSTYRPAMAVIESCVSEGSCH